MRNLILTTAALMAALATPALAYEPSQGVTFREFVEARGCVLNEVKGKAGNVLYLTFASGCPAVEQFTAEGQNPAEMDGTLTGPVTWGQVN